MITYLRHIIRVRWPDTTSDAELGRHIGLALVCKEIGRRKCQWIDRSCIKDWPQLHCGLRHAVDFSLPETQGNIKGVQVSQER